jgi:hypothetical protein
MDVPNVKRKDYQLIGMEDDFLSLMDDSGDTRDDLKCPEGEIGDEIRAAISEEKEILVSLRLLFTEFWCILAQFFTKPVFFFFFLPSFYMNVPSPTHEMSSIFLATSQ